MTYCPIFEPFYLKYTLPENHQQEMIDRLNVYCQKKIQNDEGIPERPNGWACEVETSFAEQNVGKRAPWSTHPHSDDLNVNEVLQHYIFHSMKELGWPINNYPIGTWYNAYGKNHYQECHSHVGSELSGVYFLSFDREIHGSFRFISPFEDMLYMAYPKIAENQHGGLPSFFRPEEEPVVSSGDLIIFPSWMKHRVLRPFAPEMPKMDEFTDETYPKRITISFNVNIFDWFEGAPNTVQNIANV